MLAFIRRGDAEPLLINVPETIERHLVRCGPHCVDRRLFMSRSACRDSNAKHDLFLAGESINSLPTFTVERKNYRPIKFRQSVRPASCTLISDGQGKLACRKPAALVWPHPMRTCPNPQEPRFLLASFSAVSL